MLHRACELGQLDLAQRLIASGKHHIDELHEGRTPLYVTARTNQTQVAAWLLSLGAQIDQPGGPEGRSAFFVACREGSTDIVKLFLSHKCDFARPHNGVTPFFEACWRGHLGVVQLLHSMGCNVSLRTVDGATPLFAACRGGHLDVVKFLLDHHATVDAPDNNSATPLYVALHEGHDAIAHAIFARRDSPHTPASVREDISSAVQSAFFVACFFGCMHAVKVLISCGGALVDSPNKGGATGFYIACQEGHLEIAQLLFAHGCNPNRQLLNGATPLFAASWRGHQQLVEFLCSLPGIDKEHGLNGCSPLFVACQHARHSVVSCLLASGCNPNSTDAFGGTPLWHACLRGDVETVKILLLHQHHNQNSLRMRGSTALKCDPNRDCDGATPFYIACRYGHVEVVRFLARVPACDVWRPRKGVTPFEAACLSGHVAVAHELARACSIKTLRAAAKSFNIPTPTTPQGQQTMVLPPPLRFLATYRNILLAPTRSLTLPESSNTSNNTHTFTRPIVSPIALLRSPASVATRGVRALNSHVSSMRDSMLAFCMGTHPRLGQDSPVRFLPMDLVVKIADGLFEWSPENKPPSTPRRESCGGGGGGGGSESGVACDALALLRLDEDTSRRR